jgi:hypothetical protein
MVTSGSARRRIPMPARSTPAAEFLDRPGLPGPFGALMDEYARAADGFCGFVETLDPGTFGAERPSEDPDTVSPLAICRHVYGAARRYSDYVRKARGLPHVDRFDVPPAAIGGPGDVRARLVEALRYTEGALEGLYDADESVYTAIRFPVRWGPTYDPEMILEHAIVHLLRHRRQLERWPMDVRK